MLCLVDLTEFLDGVEVADQTFGTVQAVGWARKQICQYVLEEFPSPAPQYLLVAGESSAMYLHACRSFWNIFVTDLVQAEHLSRRGIELVMVDLERGEGRVEGQLNVRDKGRVLQRHQSRRHREAVGGLVDVVDGGVVVVVRRWGES